MICYECGNPACVLVAWMGHQYAYCKACFKRKPITSDGSIKPDDKGAEDASEGLAHLFG